MIKRKNKHEFRVTAPVNKPVTNADLEEMRDWCANTFGPGGRKREYRWRYGWFNRDADTFYFRNEKDALFFALRWS